MSNPKDDERPGMGAEFREAREIVGEAWVQWGQRKGWTPENEVFNPDEWTPFVDVIAQHLARRRDEPAGERAVARAREILGPLRDINAHMGYQFTQPLMVAEATIAAALTDRRAASGGTDEWRCEGCGEDVARADLVISHTRSEHHDECRGECVSCPVPVACGPVSQPAPTSGAGEPGDARARAERLVAEWEGSDKWNAIADDRSAREHPHDTAAQWLARVVEQRKGLVALIAAVLPQGPGERGTR